MTQKENGRLDAPAVLIFPRLPNGNRAQYSATCKSSGIAFLTAFARTVGARHLRAARALLRGSR